MTPTSTDVSPPWGTPFKVAVVVILVVLTGIALYAFQVVFIPLIVGCIIAYILHPAVEWIRSITPLGKGPATGVVYALIVLVVVPLVVLLTPFLTNSVDILAAQTVSLVDQISNLPPDAAIAFGLIEIPAQQIVNDISNGLIDAITASTGDAVLLVLDVAQLVVLGVFTFIISFYLTVDSERFVQSIQDLVPERYEADFNLILTDVERIWRAFFRGHTALAFAVGGLVTALSFAIGLPLPVFFGISAGLLEFLPGVGHVLWLIAMLIVAGVQGSTWLPVSNGLFMLLTLVLHFVYLRINNRVLIPRLVGLENRIHPLLVILAVIAGGSIAGLLGIVLAAPTFASLLVIGRYVHGKLVDREQPIQPGEPLRLQVPTARDTS
ncbi:MAG: AI-2E family transporter [Chloroflexi bacterium]|nr:AI-2E family transporter [Chloroflexota bacterium]